MSESPRPDENPRFGSTQAIRGTQWNDAADLPLPHTRILLVLFCSGGHTVFSNPGVPLPLGRIPAHSRERPSRGLSLGEPPGPLFPALFPSPGVLQERSPPRSAVLSARDLAPPRAHLRCRGPLLPRLSSGEHFSTRGEQLAPLLPVLHPAPQAVHVPEGRIDRPGRRGSLPRPSP